MQIQHINAQILQRLHPTSSTPVTSMPFKTTAKDIEQWKQNIPILNTEITGKHLQTAAQAIYTSTLPSSEKQSLAEQLYPLLVQYYNECKNKVLDIKLPLSEKNDGLTHLVLDVLDCFSDIYISIIISGDFTQLNEKKQTLALFRAMEILGLVQLFLSLTYQAPPDSIWGDLNTLFFLAEKNKLECIDCSDQNNESNFVQTIEAKFKKIHFFHLALPNRFRQHDIDIIFKVLDKNSQTILLSKEASEEDGFIIDIDKDLPLSFFTADQQHTPTTRYINNKMLISSLLNDSVKSSGQENLSFVQTLKLSHYVLHKLLPCWQQESSRLFSRQKQQNEIFIYPGFQNIIKQLSSITKKNSTSGKNKTTYKNKSLGLPGIEVIPIEGEHFKNQDFRSEKEIINKIKQSHSDFILAENIWGQQQTKPTNDFSKINASIKDSSASGLMFIVSADTKSIFKAGDLIAIENNQQLQLAIIRRLNNLNIDGVSIGVELISPSIQLAEICNPDKSIRSREVLFLPAIEEIKQPDSIITLSSIKNTRMDLKLKIAQQETTFCISKMLETNPIFTHYTLQKPLKSS